MPDYYGDSLSNDNDAPWMQGDEQEDFVCSCGYSAKYGERCLSCEGKEGVE